MKIKLGFSENDSKKLTSKENLKFVLIKQHREKILLIFECHYDHISIKNEVKNLSNKIFIGAGKLELSHNIKVKWGSFSFEKVLGRDKPINKDKRENILEEIKNEFQKWYDKIQAI